MLKTSDGMSSHSSSHRLLCWYSSVDKSTLPALPCICYSLMHCITLKLDTHENNTVRSEGSGKG